MKKKSIKNTPRLEYLKTVLQALELDPKKFMYAVTHNAPSQTTLYHFINQLHKKQKPYIMAKRMILKKVEIEQMQDEIRLGKFATHIIPAPRNKVFVS